MWAWLSRLLGRPKLLTTTAYWCALHQEVNCVHRLKGPGDVIGVYFGVTYYADGSAVHADGTCEPQLGYSTAYAHD